MRTSDTSKLGLAPSMSRRGLLKAGAALGALSVVSLSACSTDSPAPTASPTPSGSPSYPATVSNAEEAGQLVLNMARYAASTGAFGIAGALIETSSGKVLQAIPNRVVQRLSPDAQQSPDEAFTFDPTAHGERQLAYWYFENREKLKLPEPQTLTLVTSLDPCAMCTGTILESGFKVAVLAADDFSGINYNGNNDFADLPEPLRRQARERFGYYGVQGGRAYVGPPDVLFADTLVTQQTFNDCGSTYQDSAGPVRSSRKDTGTPPDQLEDPGFDPSASAVRDAFTAVYSGAFSLKLNNFRRPNEKLQEILTDLRDSTPKATNAVAFIDPFGNLLCAFADSFNTNPVATAFQNVAQAYSKVRFDLVNNPSTQSIAQQTLTSPKYGTFVFLNAPSPTLATSYESLGAFGSTMESQAPQPKPSPFQFYQPPLQGSVSQLREVISKMPPLYSNLVKINPQQVRT